MIDRDVYFVPRKSSRGRSRGRRTATLIIAALVILSAGICLLVFLLPARTTGQASAGFSGKTFYFLVTEETGDRSAAGVAAESAASRGGAGYIYNDGIYRIVAAAYMRESDVKTLVSVNPGSSYFSLQLPSSKNSAAALGYLTGEWFDRMSVAATELDRGNITEAAAEFTAESACRALARYARGASGRLGEALAAASEYSVSQSRPTLSYLRFIQVRAIIYAARSFD